MEKRKRQCSRCSHNRSLRVGEMGLIYYCDLIPNNKLKIYGKSVFKKCPLKLRKENRNEQAYT